MANDKGEQPRLLIPDPLPLAVADNRLRMLSPVLAEIVGMSIPSLLLAVARGLAVRNLPSATLP